MNGTDHRDGLILFAASPSPGHVNPMLAIARSLRDRGYPILFNTAELFREQVTEMGLSFEPFTGFADFDYRNLEEAFPERKNFKPGPEMLVHDFTTGFARPIPDQYRRIREFMDAADVRLIFTDAVFMGAFPLLLGRPQDRPPVISCGVLPMVLSSVDTSPSSAPAGRDRNREDTRQFQAVLAPVQEYTNKILDGLGAPPLPAFFLDCCYTLPDLFLQLTAEEFEYPRTDLPANVRFAGTIPPPPAAGFRPPQWWERLDAKRPVVLVTQGTIANADLSELIGPTLEGLAGEDLLVIAATGRPDGYLAGPIPSNAIVTEYVPFTELLPRVDVFVTNGGYGAVNLALSHGVPMVVAGETEDKAFVADRVAWTGTGINLRTGHPSALDLRGAVQRILGEAGFRAAARQFRSHFARYNALDDIGRRVDELLAGPGGSPALLGVSKA